MTSIESLLGIYISKRRVSYPPVGGPGSFDQPIAASDATLYYDKSTILIPERQYFLHLSSNFLELDGNTNALRVFRALTLPKAHPRMMRRSKSKNMGLHLKEKSA